MNALNIDQSNPGWFFKYKLYHIPFWFAYHYLWWTITIGSAWDAASNILFSAYSIKFSFYAIFQALGVYFNLYYLIPRFLEKGKFVSYGVSLFVTIIVAAAFIVTGYYVSAWLSVYTFKELYNVDPKNFLFFFQVNTLPSTVASMTLAMTIKLTKNWIQSRQREQALEKEKLETELKFLKSQINPHFLFNTINSIFVLINKNPKMASESLARFSSMLRYQLYECNEQKIPLDQELSYLQNFMALQKLRQDEDNLEQTFNLELPFTGNLIIAPFVLMPFVENSFKHVSVYPNQPNWIRMNLMLTDKVLQFEISNTTSSLQSSARQYIQQGGVGLKNIQRRLDLLYPGDHVLTITHSNDIFSVTLTLTLDERAVPEPAALNNTVTLLAS